MTLSDSDSANAELAITSQRVLLPGGIRPATILLGEGEILAINEPGKAPEGIRHHDAGHAIVAPGVIDTHVHVNQPGRTEWEGFETATRAAAAGGITTIVDMPLNSEPVTTSPKALELKREAAAPHTRINIGFYGGLVADGANAVTPLLEAGVLGIKAFMCDSGLESFPAVTKADLETAMPLIAAAKAPLLAHAEYPITSAPTAGFGNRYADYLASRPCDWEMEAITLLTKLSQASGCHVHVVHLANGEAIEFIKQSQAAGTPITVETGPHYLYFEAEKIPNGDPRYKCAPPIRGAKHRELLWKGLRNSTITTIGSDHSPCPPEMKHLDSGDLFRAWGGIASLQMLLSATWTAGKPFAVQPKELFDWLSANPAKLIGQEHRKGQIAVGYDADLVIWDPDAEQTVEAAALQHRHPVTPYEGHSLRGKVLQTLVAGQVVYDQGNFTDAMPGKLLTRNNDL